MKDFDLAAYFKQATKDYLASGKSFITAYGDFEPICEFYGILTDGIDWLINDQNYVPSDYDASEDKDKKTLDLHIMDEQKIPAGTMYVYIMVDPDGYITSCLGYPDFNTFYDVLKEALVVDPTGFLQVLPQSFLGR